MGFFECICPVSVATCLVGQIFSTEVKLTAHFLNRPSFVRTSDKCILKYKVLLFSIRVLSYNYIFFSPKLLEMLERAYMCNRQNTAYFRRAREPLEQDQFGGQKKKKKPTSDPRVTNIK